MSAEDAPELGITEADRKRMGELYERSKNHGRAMKQNRFGFPTDAPVECACEAVPESFTPAQRLVAAYLFAVRKTTAREAADAVGVSYPPTKKALDALADYDLANRTTGPREGRGRRPTMYVSTPPERFRAD